MMRLQTRQRLRKRERSFSAPMPHGLHPKQADELNAPLDRYRKSLSIASLNLAVRPCPVSP
jgi:hypothetical protein